MYVLSNLIWEKYRAFWSFSPCETFTHSPKTPPTTFLPSQPSLCFLCADKYPRWSLDWLLCSKVTLARVISLRPRLHFHFYSASTPPIPPPSNATTLTPCHPTLCCVLTLSPLYNQHFNNGRKSSERCAKHNPAFSLFSFSFSGGGGLEPN